MINFLVRILTSVTLFLVFIFLVYNQGIYFKILLIFIFLFGVYEITKLKNKKILLIIFLIFIFFILCLYNLRIQYNGLFLLVWCCVITWLTDSFGFIFGKMFGKKKIGPISPNKTYIGLIGGVLMSQFSYIIVNNYLNNSLFLNFKIIFLVQFLTSVLVVFGDLLFSYFKRQMNIKDYSNIFPGHGGLFDRIDGLIFSVIFFNIIF